MKLFDSIQGKKWHYNKGSCNTTSYNITFMVVDLKKKTKKKLSPNGRSSFQKIRRIKLASKSSHKLPQSASAARDGRDCHGNRR